MLIYTLSVPPSMVVLVAVEGKNAPGEKIRVGHRLATTHGEQLVVLHVISQETFDQRHSSSLSGESDGSFGDLGGLAPGGDSQRSQTSTEGTYTLETAQRDGQLIAKAATEETLEEATDISYRGRVGDPAEEILAEAEHENTQYIVIGGRKRSPVGKAFFGSTTQSVLLRATNPVVTVMDQE